MQPQGVVALETVLEALGAVVVVMAVEVVVVVAVVVVVVGVVVVVTTTVAAAATPRLSWPWERRRHLCAIRFLVFHILAT